MPMIFENSAVAQEDNEVRLDEMKAADDEEDVVIIDENKSGDSLLYGVDDAPPWYLCFLFGFQQYLLAVAGLIALPMLVMNSICADDSEAGNVSRSFVLGTVFFVSGIATFIQSTFGIRLPILQGITSSYFIPAIIIMSTDRWRCPARLNLHPNSTIGPNITMFSEANFTKTFLLDGASNRTLLIDVGFNYYRDNDGELVNSNELWQRRMRDIQGGVIISSLLQIVIGFTGATGFMMRFIGPLTIAPILILTTYSLIGIAMHEASKQWGISLFIVFAFYVSSQILHKIEVPLPKIRCSKRSVKFSTGRLPLFGLFPIIVAIGLGWLLCYIITVAGGFPDDPHQTGYLARTDSTPGVIANSPWFSFPYPGQWGMPTLSVTTVLGMLAAVIPGILDSIGAYYACAKITYEPPPPIHAINRGVLMEGFGILLTGLLGTGNATSSFSDNIIGIRISRVGSRRVFQYTSGILVFLGLFTKFCSVFVTMPDAIIGGIALSVIGMIGAVGISTLKHVDMTTSRNLFILGFSTFFAMCVSMFAGDRRLQQQIDVGVEDLNNIFLVILQIPMFIGGFVAFILDNITPGSRESRGLMDFSEGCSADSKVYQLPFNTDFGWTRWIPLCPRYKKSAVKT